MSEKHKDTQALVAAADVLSLIPQVVSIAVGLSGVAYYAGLRESASYYNQLGADWAVSWLTTADVFQRGFELVLPVAITVFIVVVNLIDHAATAAGIRQWSKWVAIAIVAAMSIELLADNLMPPIAAHIIAYVAGFLWSVLAGLNIGQLIAHRAEGDHEWRSQHMWLVYFVIVYGLWMAPTQIGRTRAELDCDPHHSPFPEVTVSGDFLSHWRLAAVVGDRILLIHLRTDQRGREFRVVDATLVTRIRSNDAKQVPR